jgi:hypothetical protein
MHELNLLPPMRRLLLQQENVVLATTRFMQQLMVGLAVLAVAGVAAAAGLWFTLKQTSQSVALEQAVKEYGQVRTMILAQNKHLDDIASQEKKHYHWSTLLPSLFEVVPLGVTISKMAVYEQQGTLLVSGQAATRTLLVSYQDRLQALPWITGLAAPPSNLLEPTNPSYTFTLKLKSGGTP